MEKRKGEKGGSNSSTPLLYVGEVLDLDGLILESWSPFSSLATLRADRSLQLLGRLIVVGF